MKQLLLTFFIVFFSIHLVQAQCTEDCVWPGDLNANGIANNLDFLALGLAYQETGPPRANNSTLWEPLEAEDWTGNLPILGTNFKHIDANGDGVIEEADQFAISINFNKTNDNFSGLLGNNLVGDDLFIVPQNTVASPGGSLIFDVHLGTEDNPIEDLYGIGFKLNLDTQYVETVNFDFFDTWIGGDEEYIGYGKFSDELDGAYAAVTRLDGSTVNGFGKIAQLEIVIVDVIIGLEVDTTACLPFPFEFENVLAIDNEEGDLMIATKSDSVQLKHPSQLLSSEEKLPADIDFNVFPNPCSDFIYIQSDKKIETLVLSNQFGQLVFQQFYNRVQTPEESLELPLTDLPTGVYFLEISNSEGKGRRKIIIQ